MSHNLQAFPSPAPIHPLSSNAGMTLRDYFAGQALVGLLALGDHRGAGLEAGRGTEIPAEAAYRIADAMLKMREKES